MAEHAPTHVLHVARPLLQIRVGEPAVRLRGRLRRRVPRRRGALAVLDRRLRRPEQRGVVEQKQMRVEDPRLGLADLLGDLRPRDLDVRARGGQRGLEPRPLFRRGLTPYVVR
jgi:hypothetical protein